MKKAFVVCLISLSIAHAVNVLVPRQRSRAGEPGFAHEVAFVDLTTARAVTQAGQQAAAGGKEGAAFTSDSADAKQPRSGSSFLCPSVSAADKAGELPVTLNGEMTCAALTPGSAPSSQAYGDVAHAEEESLKHKHTMMECCKESYRQGLGCIWKKANEECSGAKVTLPKEKAEVPKPKVEKLKAMVKKVVGAVAVKPVAKLPADMSDLENVPSPWVPPTADKPKPTAAEETPDAKAAVERAQLYKDAAVCNVERDSFCNHVVPKNAAVYCCLDAHKDKLSEACKKHHEKYGKFLDGEIKKVKVFGKESVKTYPETPVEVTITSTVEGFKVMFPAVHGDVWPIKAVPEDNVPAKDTPVKCRITKMDKDLKEVTCVDLASEHAYTYQFVNPQWSSAHEPAVVTAEAHCETLMKKRLDKVKQAQDLKDEAQKDVEKLRNLKAGGKDGPDAAAAQPAAIGDAAGDSDGGMDPNKMSPKARAIFAWRSVKSLTHHTRTYQGLASQLDEDISAEMATHKEGKELLSQEMTDMTKTLFQSGIEWADVEEICTRKLPDGKHMDKSQCEAATVGGTEDEISSICVYSNALSEHFVELNHETGEHCHSKKIVLLVTYLTDQEPSTSTAAKIAKVAAHRELIQYQLKLKMESEANEDGEVASMQQTTLTKEGLAKLEKKGKETGFLGRLSGHTDEAKAANKKVAKHMQAGDVMSGFPERYWPTSLKDFESRTKAKMEWAKDDDFLAIPDPSLFMFEGHVGTPADAAFVYDNSHTPGFKWVNVESECATVKGKEDCKAHKFKNTKNQLCAFTKLRFCNWNKNTKATVCTEKATEAAAKDCTDCTCNSVKLANFVARDVYIRERVDTHYEGTSSKIKGDDEYETGTHYAKGMHLKLLRAQARTKHDELKKGKTGQ